MGVAALVGAPIKRREDPRLITGQATYVDDIKLTGMLHMAVLRSPYGHARIDSINTEAALKQPGVVAVYTGRDLKGAIGQVPVAVPLGRMTEGMGMREPLTYDKVRYYGDPVAVVIASDRYTARDARDLIEVDYEPLPAAIDVEKAKEPGAPLLYEEFGTNVPFSMASDTTEIDKVFAQTRADGGVVVKHRFVSQRLTPNAIETRGVVADYRKFDKSLTVWSSSQIPHLLRNLLAGTLGLPTHQIRVIVPEVGGGFGSKLNVYPEEMLAAHLAIKLGRPVKWIEERSENQSATIQGRGQVAYIELAATKEGRITGMKLHVVSDLGAYSQLLTDALVLALMFPVVCGAYDVPHLYTSLETVFTNKTPTDAYRGAGRPEAAYVIERAMDLLAHELGKDPVEVRQLNFIKPEQFPYKSATGVVYDTGDYELPLRKALELVDYPNLKAEVERQRAAGKLIGIGFSTYIEICGLGPKGMNPVGLYESARVRIDADGTATVYTGSSPHGQGEETTFAQIVSEELTIPVEKIIVLHGDTATTPEGRGTYGSRTTAVGGSAVFRATQNLAEKMKQIAAHFLEASPADIVLENGTFSVSGSPQKTQSFVEIAAAANFSNTLPASIEPGLESTVFWEPEFCTFPFGTHICVAEVDKETGEPQVLRYVAVDDCGRILNPMIVHGQLHGGIVQGIGQALFEGTEYSADGQLLTGSFMDYAMPMASEFPNIELDHTITLTTVNPLGVKGIGEAGTIASTPAVANAICDALGVDDIEMPFKPEKLWKIIHKQ